MQLSTKQKHNFYSHIMFRVKQTFILTYMAFGTNKSAWVDEAREKESMDGFNLD